MAEKKNYCDSDAEKSISVCSCVYCALWWLLWQRIYSHSIICRYERHSRLVQLPILAFHGTHTYTYYTATRLQLIAPWQYNTCSLRHKVLTAFTCCHFQFNQSSAINLYCPKSVFMWRMFKPRGAALRTLRKMEHCCMYRVFCTHRGLNAHTHHKAEAAWMRQGICLSNRNGSTSLNLRNSPHTQTQGMTSDTWYV